MEKLLDSLLKPFYMRFDKELEKEFVLLRNAQTNKNVRYITASLIVCIGIYFSLNQHSALAVASVKFALPFFVAFLLATFIPGDYRHGHFLVATASAVLQLTIFWIIMTRIITDVSQVKFYFIVIFVFGHYFGIQMLFIPALISGGVIFLGMLLIFQATYPELISTVFYNLVICHFLGASVCYRIDATERDSFISLRGISDERKKTEALIHRVLPTKLAGVLSEEGSQDFSDTSECSILFVRLDVSHNNSKPNDYQETFKIFDRIVARSKLQKIKTFKNIYIVAGGVFSSENQLEELLLVATEFRLQSLKSQSRLSDDIEFRAGISAGSVSHGVIGKRTFAFDVWGAPVNLASRIMSKARKGEINLDDESSRLLPGRYEFSEPQKMDLKGFEEINVRSLSKIDFSYSSKEKEVA